MRIDAALSAVLRQLLPERCELCLRAAPGPVCADCRTELPWNDAACPLNSSTWL